MNRLKELRLAKGKSLRAMAKDIGVSSPCVLRYETGERKPNIDMLLKLADYFGVSVDYLLKRDVSIERELRSLQSRLKEIQPAASKQSELTGAYIKEAATKIDIAAGHLRDVR